MKKVIVIFLSLCCNMVFSQVCDLESELQKLEQLLHAGGFEKIISSSQDLMSCESLAELQKVPIHIIQYKAFRNQYQFKDAQQVLIDGKTILEKHHLEIPFEFRLLLIENYGHNSNNVEYLKIMEPIADSILSASEVQAGLLGRYYLSSYRITNMHTNLDLAIHHLLDALKAFDRLESPPVFYYGNTLRNLGNMYRTAGDFDKSNFYYKKGREFIAEHYPKDHYEIAYYDYTIGAVYYEKMEYKSALDYFLEARKTWVNQLSPEAMYMRYLNEAIGDMYWELNDPKNALKYFDFSIVDEQEVNNDESELTIKKADSLIENGNYADAIHYYEEAHRWRENEFGKNNVQTAACKNFVARAIRYSGDTEGALTAYQQAIGILVSEMADSSWYANPSINMHVQSHQYLQESLISKGELLKELYDKTRNIDDLQAALDTQEIALTFLEDIKNSQLSEASREFWTERALNLVESAISTAIELFEVTDDIVYLKKAFNFSERSKALLLLASLYDQEIKSFVNVSEEIISEENRLKKQMNEYVGKIESEEKRCADVRTKILTLWKTQLNSLQISYDLLVERIKTEYPDYYQLKFGLQSVSLEEIQKKVLNETTALISYFTGAKNSYVFFITQNDVSVRVIKDTKSLFELADSYFDILSSREDLRNDPQLAFEKFTADGFMLYSKLLEPELHDQFFESLIIIPDGRLCYLPYESFITVQVNDQERDYQSLSYVLKDYAVSYSPSASIKLLSETNPGKNVRYVGFAPDYEGEVYADQDNSQLRLLPLKYNIREIEAASELFGGKVWSGSEVSEELLKNNSEQIGILHLAMHGSIEDKHPLLSKVFFSPTDKEDGMLHIYEIYNMQIPAQLVILSACNTASGKWVRGEGILSLERAFQYAGSKALLSTLWTVDDAASLQLNRYFLENLKSGSSKDLALRDAKLQFLSTAAPENLHPFFWSSFRLTGNTQPLVTSSSTPIMMIMGLGILSLIAGFVFRRRKKGKQSA